MLRDLLVAAASGGAAPSEASEARPRRPRPDPLMTELAGRLRREGLVVGERVGTGPHRVDLALTVPGHPERWLVAVDGDGPGYATWRGTRERDRLWPQELERRGWRHLRVWSTDLYRDPARDVARIVTVVREEARALAGSTTTAPEEAGGGRRGHRRPRSPDRRRQAPKRPSPSRWMSSPARRLATAVDAERGRRSGRDDAEAAGDDAEGRGRRAPLARRARSGSADGPSGGDEGRRQTRPTPPLRRRTTPTPAGASGGRPQPRAVVARPATARTGADHRARR